jgi:hypothetical protein
MRGRNLDRVCRCSNSHDGDAEAEDEATDDELRQCKRTRDDDDANDDDRSADEHGFETSKTVRHDGGKGSADDGTAAYKFSSASLSKLSCSPGCEDTDTEYRQNITETFGPVVPLWNWSWKKGMSRTAVMSEPDDGNRWSAFRHSGWHCNMLYSPS